MTRAGHVLAVWLLVLVLAACAGGSVQPEPGPSAVLPTETDVPLSTSTPTEYRGLCAYVWSDQHLPQASLHLLRTLQSSGLDQVEVSVSAYGETCVDSGTNVVVSFTPQTTNYTLVVLVANAADLQALGDLLARIIPVVEEFHTAENLGGRLGLLEVQFQDGATVALFSFPVERGIELVRQGLSGSTLLDRLQP